jgi:hypothetical protein
MRKKFTDEELKRLKSAAEEKLRELEDEEYLKSATLAELMKLTNGIPWQICCSIRVKLLAVGRRPSVDEALEEMHKWKAAGAVQVHENVVLMWVVQQELATCPECKYSKPENYQAPFKLTFSKENGFGLHHLCASCGEDFDNHYGRPTVRRWEGRCLQPAAVAQ